MAKQLLMKMKLLFIISKQNFKIMWEKVKDNLKGLWWFIKWFGGFGLATDLIFQVWRPEKYLEITGGQPLFAVWAYPLIGLLAFIVMSIVIKPVFLLIFKFIELIPDIPDWLVNITPKWLRRLLNSTFFWLCLWSIFLLLIASM